MRRRNINTMICFILILLSSYTGLDRPIYCKQPSKQIQQNTKYKNNGAVAVTPPRSQALE